MQLDRRTMAYARLAVREAATDYLRVSNVSMIDFGYLEQGGKIVEDSPAIRFHVHEKIEPAQLESAILEGVTEELPTEVGGFRTDIHVGDYQLNRWAWPRYPITNKRKTRQDPMRGGISAANEHLFGAGTLGGLVFDRTTGEPMMLSNWHVFGGTRWTRPGQAILQPARGDGGSNRDLAGRLVRDGMGVNVDAAVATIENGRDLINDQLMMGPITGVAQARIGDRVMKSGRTTDITTGRVVGVFGISEIQYPIGPRRIPNVVTIDPDRVGGEVSDGGDSGSIWIKRGTREAIGLHFAGGNRPERALAIDMNRVLNTLNVDLAIQRRNVVFGPEFEAILNR